MLKVTGLWRKAGKNGHYLSGNLGNVRVIILPNKYKKEGDNAPDYHLMFAPKQTNEQKKEAAPLNLSENDFPF